MVYEVTKNRVETLCKMIKRSQFSVNNSFHDRSSVPMQIVGNNTREGKYVLRTIEGSMLPASNCAIA